MKKLISHPLTALKSAGLAALLAWGGSAQACAPEPYIGAVCIMAVPWTNLYGYSPANGATLNLSTNQTLFSLIGITYGGNATTNFMLPDMRGRVVVGAGAGAPGGIPSYNPGDKGGAASVTLNATNVPLLPHTHGVAGIVATVGIGNLTATTTMSGLSATTSLAGVSATVDGSKLTLKGYNANGGTPSPEGATLAVANGSPSKVYSSSAPNVPMSAGSIAGTAPVAFSGNPTTTIAGSPTTTLNGAPAVTLTGTTAVSAATAAPAPVSIMPPFLAMNYFIATQGIYPSRD